MGGYLSKGGDVVDAPPPPSASKVTFDLGANQARASANGDLDG
jgi:hypothetical protein